jgi:hypothetical protein
MVTPMGIQDDYKPGQKAFYHKRGEILRVEVLEAPRDEEFEKYHLKVLEIVRKCPTSVETKVGDEFTCDRRRMGGACCGMWHLIDK